MVHTTHRPVPSGVCEVCYRPWPCPTPWKQANIRRPFWWARTPEVSPDEAAEARDFVADWLHDEEAEDEAAQAWYWRLAEHVGTLPPDDPRLVTAARAIAPLLADDEERIEAVIYPQGEAVQFVDRMGTPDDLDLYFAGFVQALLADCAMWGAIERTYGPDARWPATGAPNLRGRRGV
jgi:hypothetical protein